MKPILTVTLLAATLVFGGLYFQQRQQAAGLQSRLDSAEKSAKTSADKAAQAEKRAKTLEARAARAEADAAGNAVRAANAEQALDTALKEKRVALTPPPASVSPNKSPVSRSGMAEMFKDPAMREMIKSQQKAFMGTAVEMTYGNLLKELNLPPDQNDKLKNLIKSKLLAASEMGMNMLASDLTPEKRKELAASLKEQTDAVNAQIRQLLGDQNYPQFELYEKMQPERQAVTGLKQQLPSSAALNPTQEQQLLQAMYDERKNFKFSTDFYNQQNSQANPAEFFTEEKLAAFAKEREQLDQLLLVKARQILTSDQLVPFQDFQKSQRDLQLNAMKMAAKMFSGGTP